MVYQKEYIAQPGQSSITDPELAYVNVLFVARSGRAHYEIDGTPSDGKPEFQYDSPSGKIVFDPDVPFTGTLADDVREKVKVIYKV